MNAARRRLLGVTVLAAVVTSCSGSGDSSTDETADEPDVTLGTVPPAEDPADSAAPDDSAATPAPTEPLATEPAPTELSTTTVLTPSPEADLPTEVTPTEPIAVTTLPGPLPTPAVQLIEVASFTEPVEVASAPGDPRLFVVENGGTVIAADEESSETVLDMSAVSATTFTDDGNEQGLLGLAFHPQLDLAYVNFTKGDGSTVIAEFAHDPITFGFDPASFREVLTVPQPFANHNGGELAFGPDELLYIGTGDGGSADDPNRASLDLSSRLGKILRIDPVVSDTEPFAVPEDNPFVGVDGVDPTIWSLGLRNPWRFTFDSLTGDLWIADVGQNRLEEVNLAIATNGFDAGKGLSFGWSAFEAEERFNDDQSPEDHVLPVVSYIHEDGNCSVSGGVVARNSSYQDLNGFYVYGDFCSGRMWALDTTSVTSTPDGPVGEPTIVEIGTVPALAAVVEGPFGDIYALSVSGTVFRLAPA